MKIIFWTLPDAPCAQMGRQAAFEMRAVKSAGVRGFGEIRPRCRICRDGDSRRRQNDRYQFRDAKPGFEIRPFAAVRTAFTIPVHGKARI